MPPCFKLRYGM